MKFFMTTTKTAACLSWLLVAAMTLAPCDSARGSARGSNDLELTRNRQRELMMNDSSDKGGGGGGGGGGSGLYGYDGINYQTDINGGVISADRVDGPLLNNQCYICTQENKVRPPSLTVQYFGGQGVMSRYQDGEKATCNTQVFPESGQVQIYGISYDFFEGAVIEFTNPSGDMDAESDFLFPSGFECYIHTSCSQPLVAGDRLGPWLVLEGNGCTFPYCGDGAWYKVDFVQRLLIYININIGMLHPIENRQHRIWFPIQWRIGWPILYLPRTCDPPPHCPIE